MLAQLLQNLTNQGVLSQDQSQTLLDLESGKRLSVHNELRLMLYAGVLFLVAGIGFTIKQYFSELGHVAIMGFLIIGVGATLIHCFAKGKKYSAEFVESPYLAFDYVLLLGCLFYSLLVTYVETHFHLLDRLWENYLLVSSALFFFLAYRFDNRLVLSLALSTLAAWFGFNLAKSDPFLPGNYRTNAIAYGLMVLLAGILLDRRAIKKHFLDLYLTFAAHFLFVATLSGIFRYKLFSLYSIGLIILCAAAANYAFRSRRFAYMVYAVIYGYIGFSFIVLDGVRNTGFALLYFIFSSIGVVMSLIYLSRQFQEKT